MLFDSNKKQVGTLNYKYYNKECFEDFACGCGLEEYIKYQIDKIGFEDRVDAIKIKLQSG